MKTAVHDFVGDQTYVELPGHRFAVTASFETAKAGDYDALCIPGGRAPEYLRLDRRVIELVQAFDKAGKPIAAICHGPQILAAAGVLRGRHVTGYRTVAGELQAAGAMYQDREVVVDDRLITSRQPADLPAFMDAVLRMLKPS